MSVVRLIKVVWAIVFMVAMVAASTVLAQAQPNNVVFIPKQPGLVGGVENPEDLTIECADATDPIAFATCDRETVEFGEPKGLICDIPVTIVIAGGIPALTGFLCHEREGGGDGPVDQKTGQKIGQESEQESESGDVDQSFEITAGGDNSNQCADTQGVAQTGNSQNVIDLVPVFSEADDFEFDEVGTTIDESPTNAAACDQQVNQAASASG